MESKMSSSPTHIFIVENNKYFVRMLDYVFSKDYSHRFIDFTSCDECVKNLHFDPKVIVLDSSLPEYRTVLNRVKKKSPKPHVILLHREQKINHAADPHTVVDEYYDLSSKSESSIHESIELALSGARPASGSQGLRATSAG